MILNTTYSKHFDGLMSYRFMELTSSSHFSFTNKMSSPTMECDSSPSRIHLISAFSLNLSMSSLSSNLSIIKRKRRMKAKFDRESYANRIQEVSSKHETNIVHELPNSLDASDYSFHIKETAGKVLDCSLDWF